MDGSEDDKISLHPLPPSSNRHSVTQSDLRKRHVSLILDTRGSDFQYHRTPAVLQSKQSSTE